MKRTFQFHTIALCMLFMFAGLSSYSQVYARIERGAIYTDYHTGYYGQSYTGIGVCVKFYTNAACTIPATLTVDLDVNLIHTETDWDYYPGQPDVVSDSYETYTALANDNTLWGLDPVKGVWYAGEGDTREYTWTLAEGAGYTIVN